MDELMICSSLKEKKKLAKKYLKNPLDFSKNCLFSQANKCINLIIQTKTDNISKISAKLGDPKSTSKNISSLLVGS